MGETIVTLPPIVSPKKVWGDDFKKIVSPDLVETFRVTEQNFVSLIVSPALPQTSPQTVTNRYAILRDFCYDFGGTLKGDELSPQTSPQTSPLALPLALRRRYSEQFLNNGLGR